MVSLTPENKALCFQDSVEKPVTVAIYEQTSNPEIPDTTYFKITETIKGEQITSESMKFEEGIIDGSKFEFGTYVFPQLQISWQYTGKRFLNKYCTVYQNIGTQWVAYMNGFITKETVSGDRQTVNATIECATAQRLDTNLAYLYNQYTVGEKITMLDFLQMVVTSGVIFIDLNGLKAKYPIVEKANFRIRNNVSQILLSDFLKFVGELTGSHIRIQKRAFSDERAILSQTFFYPTDTLTFVRADNNVEYIYPSSNTYPSTTTYPLMTADTVISNPTYNLPYCINLEYDDYPQEPYKRYDVKLWYVQESNEFEKTQTVYPVIGENNAVDTSLVPAYTFDMTTCDKAFSDIYWSSGVSFLLYIRNTIYPYLLNAKYVISNLEYTYAPFLEPGDNVIATTASGKTMLIPILSSSASGINALRGTIRSETTAN